MKQQDQSFDELTRKGKAGVQKGVQKNNKGPLGMVSDRNFYSTGKDIQGTPRLMQPMTQDEHRELRNEQNGDAGREGLRRGRGRGVGRGVGTRKVPLAGLVDLEREHAEQYGGLGNKSSAAAAAGAAAVARSKKMEQQRQQQRQARPRSGNAKKRSGSGGAERGPETIDLVSSDDEENEEEGDGGDGGEKEESKEEMERRAALQAVQHAEQAEARKKQRTTRQGPARSSLTNTDVARLEGLRCQMPPEGEEGVGVVQFTAADLGRLGDDEFLNDTAIDYYLRWIRRELDLHHPEKASRCYFFNSFFYKKLVERSGASKGRGADLARMNYDKVKKWTRGVDIFEKDYVFVPIHDHLHWSLMIICHPGAHAPAAAAVSGAGPVSPSPSHPTPTQETASQTQPSTSTSAADPRLAPPPQAFLLHLDSLAAGHNSTEPSNSIKQYLQCEWEAKMAQEPQSVAASWAASHPNQTLHFSTMKYKRPKVPDQDNYCDCGLFLCSYVEFFTAAMPPSLNYAAIEKLSKRYHLDGVDVWEGSEHCYPGFLTKQWFEVTNGSRLRWELASMVLREMAKNAAVVVPVDGDTSSMKTTDPSQWKIPMDKCQAVLDALEVAEQQKKEKGTYFRPMEWLLQAQENKEQRRREVEEKKERIAAEAKRKSAEQQRLRTSQGRKIASVIDDSSDGGDDDIVLDNKNKNNKNKNNKTSVGVPRRSMVRLHGPPVGRDVRGNGGGTVNENKWNVVMGLESQSVNAGKDAEEHEVDITTTGTARTRARAPASVSDVMSSDSGSEEEGGQKATRGKRPFNALLLSQSPPPPPPLPHALAGGSGDRCEEEDDIDIDGTTDTDRGLLDPAFMATVMMADTPNDTTNVVAEKEDEETPTPTLVKKMKMTENKNTRAQIEEEQEEEEEEKHDVVGGTGREIKGIYLEQSASDDEGGGGGGGDNNTYSNTKKKKNTKKQRSIDFGVRKGGEVVDMSLVGGSPVERGRVLKREGNGNYSHHGNGNGNGHGWNQIKRPREKKQTRLAPVDSDDDDFVDVDKDGKSGRRKARKSGGGNGGGGGRNGVRWGARTEAATQSNTILHLLQKSKAAINNNM